MAELALHSDRTGLMLFMPTLTFGQWIQGWLDKTGLKQSDLVQRTGLAKSYINTLVRDVPNSTTGRVPRPEPEVVAKIARALGAPINEARAAAGYAILKETPETQEALLQSRFGLLMTKYQKLKKSDRPYIEPLLDMVDRELDKRLPPGATLPVDAQIDDK